MIRNKFENEGKSVSEVYGKHMPYHCSFFEKGKITSLHESGHTIDELAEEKRRHYTTIARWLRQFE